MKLPATETLMNDKTGKAADTIMKTLRYGNGESAEYDPKVILKAMNDYARAVKSLFDKTQNQGQKVFLTTNVVGEYAELVVCETLGLKKAPPSTKDFDAVDDAGKTYQVKSRWMNRFSSKNGKNEFGSIPVSSDKTVDYLAMVTFRGDDFGEAEIFVLDLKKNLSRLFKSCEDGTLPQKIVSKTKDGSKYLFYYHDRSFAMAVNKGLLRHYPAVNRDAAGKAIKPLALAVANHYLRHRCSLIDLEKEFRQPQCNGSMMKYWLNGLGIDTSPHGHGAILAGRHVSDELPSAIGKFRETLLLIQKRFGD